MYIILFYRETQKLIKDLVVRLKKVEKSEKHYRKELNKVVELNKEADQK